MIKLTCRFFLPSNNFFIIFFTYIKMPKDWAAKYYQIIKKDFNKKLVRDIKVFLKKKKKNDNMVVKDTKIYQKMKNKSLLDIEKNVIKWEKTSYCNYKKLLF